MEVCPQCGYNGGRNLADFLHWHQGIDRGDHKYARCGRQWIFINGHPINITTKKSEVKCRACLTCLKISDAPLTKKHWSTKRIDKRKITTLFRKNGDKTLWISDVATKLGLSLEYATKLLKELIKEKKVYINKEER